MTAHANALTTRAMNAGPTVPSGDVRGMLIALGNLGFDTEALMRDIGLSPALRDDPDARVPCEMQGALFARACQVRPMRNFGLRMAEALPLGAFPLIDYLVVTTDTVGEALKQLARYYLLLASGVTMSFREDLDPIEVAIDGPVRLVDEVVSSLIVLHLRRETNGPFAPAYVSFKHQPDDVADFERTLCCPIRASAAWAGVAVPTRVWQLPMRRRDPILRGVLERHANALAQRIPIADDIVHKVRRLLTSQIAGGDTRISVVARQLATAPRTLQRKLAEAGASYQELLDVTRKEVAERHLADSVLSIGELAYLLGYSEPAAFHRAFKRWHQMTPHAFRSTCQRTAL
jgi:AraC-like DNA-binding protein